MDYNYFEVLELSIADIQDENEATIKKRVNDAHTKLYALTIGAYANVPRSDGLTQTQWQKVLNDAKATLLDPRKRQKHIADLMPEPETTHAPETTEIPEPETTQTPETTEIPEPETTQTPETEKTRSRVGFFKYCRVVSKDIASDYFFWNSIRFLRDCLRDARYWWLIATICGTLAGGLVFYGGSPASLIELFESVYVSPVASIHFDFSYFLTGCLYGFLFVVPFIRGASRKRLGLMIKRLIMIAIAILAIYVPYMFDWDENLHGNFHFLLPAALIIIFYYTVGYIRIIRYLRSKR